MKLEFLIDKKYIFLHAFDKDPKNKPFEGWPKFILEKWNKYPQECCFLAGFAEWPLLNKNKSLKTLAIKTEKLLEKWLKTPLAKRLIKETETYCNWLEKEWQIKGNQALAELEQIIKIPLPKKKISVYVTHPKLKNGMAISPKIITWGHSEDWPNYSIVYLCHEIMHILNWNEKNNKTITHAIIELAIDNELRIRLNKKGKYFKERKFNVGHSRLQNIEKNIYSPWKKYLKNPKQNLKQFIKLQNKKASNYNKI